LGDFRPNACCRLSPAAGGDRISKQFFFEKKNQKTFICCTRPRAKPVNCRSPRQVKVFWFFFSKKKCFLSFV
jgi:hypothetical protein